MKKRDLLKMIVFLAMAAFLLSFCSKIAFLNLRGFNDHEAFYDCAEDTVDVIFIGGSMSYAAFCPAELYDHWGISSYNFGTSNQSMLAGYIWAQEAYEHQNYKVIVSEAMAIPMSHGEIATDIRSLFSMGINHNYLKLAAVYKRNSYKVLFPILVLHDGWEISEKTFREVGNANNQYLRGFVPLFSRAGEEYQSSILFGDETATEYIKVPYLDRLREYCDENGIQLILVKTLMASNEVNNWNDGYHNVVQAYADQYNIPFIDFNTQEYMDAADLIISEDVAADLRHMSYSGAQKATDFLGEYIMQLEGTRINLYDDPGFDDETLEKYYSIMQEVQNE